VGPYEHSVQAILFPNALIMTFSSLPQLANICIPPALAEEAMQKASEGFHPAWTKWRKRGKHFVITTDSLEDLSELADFARVELEEPEKPLTKTRRAACQALLDRTHRHAILEPLGDCHCIATAWRDKPLPSGKTGSKVMHELRRDKKGLPLGRGSRTKALTVDGRSNR